MEIRKIRQEEKTLTEQLEMTVFLATTNDMGQPGNGWQEVWGGYNDAGKLQASLHAIDYNVRFDGHAVGMVGIGGVGTLPEARKGGYIRKIFEKALPAAREEGKLFSYLYPFSFEFYRKFGYELGCQKNLIEMPAKALCAYAFPDGMEAFAPGGDITPYAGVYTRFIAGKNLALVRDEKSMKEKVDRDPYAKRKYAYLHRDANGEPDAYLCYGVDKKDGQNVLDVEELIWTTPESLHAMFGFVGGLSAEFGLFRWNAPQNVNAAALFPNGYEITVTRPMCGMNRVLNVPKVFEKMKAPRVNGSAVIKVTDKFMPVNDGAYLIEWENGAVSLVKATGLSPDMEITVETLSQLVTGFLTTGEAGLKKGVSINGNEAALEMLFPRKDLCIYDYF